MIRSLLFVPGDRKDLFGKALASPADGIILDLEDSVAPDAKDTARSAVQQFLDEGSPGDDTVCVRINEMERGGFEDARIVAHDAVDWVMVPMAETQRGAWHTATTIAHFEERNGADPAQVAVSIETPTGVANANDIATAHEKLAAISFGLADYTVAANLETTETRGEVHFQRASVANAAGLAHLQALDFATLETSDVEQVRRDAETARSMGYSGKVAIHPDQIEPIHDVFTPDEEAIEHARRVVETYEAKDNPGVVEIDGEMVDKPVVENARRTLELAESLDR